MGKEMERLCNDEVVDYIAHRHHTIPIAVLQSFFRLKGIGGVIKLDMGRDETDVHLEDNEMEILSDLLFMAQCK